MAPMVVNTHEAKTHLSRLIERAAAGEEIILAKAGKPMAKLVPSMPSRGREPSARHARLPQVDAGRAHVPGGERGDRPP